MSEIETRLAALEQGQRRWKQVCLVLTSLLLGVGLLAAKSAVPDVLQCHQLEIVNDQGVVVSRLECLPKDQGGDGGWATFYGNNGQPKVHMGAQVGGDGALQVSSGTAATDGIVSISASPEGGGQMTLSGPNQAPYIRLAAAPGKSGRISLTNKTGAELWHAGQ